MIKYLAYVLMILFINACSASENYNDMKKKASLDRKTRELHSERIVTEWDNFIGDLFLNNDFLKNIKKEEIKIITYSTNNQMFTEYTKTETSQSIKFGEKLEQNNIADIFEKNICYIPVLYRLGGDHQNPQGNIKDKFYNTQIGFYSFYHNMIFKFDKKENQTYYFSEVKSNQKEFNDYKMIIKNNGENVIVENDKSIKIKWIIKTKDKKEIIPIIIYK
ncbi:MAG: hypothetical protein ACRCVW_03195 [Brevinema sp.]